MVAWCHCPIRITIKGWCIPYIRRAWEVGDTLSLIASITTNLFLLHCLLIGFLSFHSSIGYGPTNVSCEGREGWSSWSKLGAPWESRIAQHCALVSVCLLLCCWEVVWDYLGLIGETRVHVSWFSVRSAHLILGLCSWCLECPFECIRVHGVALASKLERLVDVHLKRGWFGLEVSRWVPRIVCSTRGADLSV